MYGRVTPFAGVWIEILNPCIYTPSHVVTPFAGVWIEITHNVYLQIFFTVTPFAGVWIEIIHYLQNGFQYASHSLRGSVD